MALVDPIRKAIWKAGSGIVDLCCCCQLSLVVGGECSIQLLLLLLSADFEAPCCPFVFLFLFLFFLFFVFVFFFCGGVGRFRWSRRLFVLSWLLPLLGPPYGLDGRSQTAGRLLDSCLHVIFLLWTFE